jgi:hypothetical protein
MNQSSKIFLSSHNEEYLKKDFFFPKSFTETFFISFSSLLFMSETKEEKEREREGDICDRISSLLTPTETQEHARHGNESEQRISKRKMLSYQDLAYSGSLSPSPSLSLSLSYFMLISSLNSFFLSFSLSF